MLYFGYHPSNYSFRYCVSYGLAHLFGLPLLLDVVIRPNRRHGSTDCKTNRFIGILPTPALFGGLTSILVPPPTLRIADLGDVAPILLRPFPTLVARFSTLRIESLGDVALVLFRSVLSTVTRGGKYIFSVYAPVMFAAPYGPVP